MEKFLKLIDGLHPEYRENCRKLYLDNKTLFDTCPGSTYNHQIWEGGYIDHMIEINRIARVNYAAMSQIRPLPFLLDEALISLFLHDLEKPWKYGTAKTFACDQERLEFVYNKAIAYGIQWTGDRWNAVKYAHGEGKDYRADYRVQTPLAAFVHCCDVMSARIWFDQPTPASLSPSLTVVS